MIDENDTFINYMKNLLDSIEDALAIYNSKNKRPAADVPDPDILLELRDTCRKFDADKVDRAMSQLESFEYENESGTELVAWLRGQVDETNYREIASGAYFMRQ